ncbi:MAG: MazG family protein [Anaerolineae bacterium]|nr:MazG family protein [Anaerolineae bacterium]
MSFTADQLAQMLAGLPLPQIESLQIMTAEALARQYYPRLDPAQPALIVGITETTDRGRLRQVLAQAYPPEHSLTLLREAVAGEITLAALDGVTDCTALFIPPLATPAAYEALQDVVAHLRAPEGCPWDRALTWAKLRATLLEETYELLAALDAQDSRKVLEEQGDLLLQIAMQAQIAAEEGRFRVPDVIAHVVQKLIRRHPHVFGDLELRNADEVLANWEAIKAAERAQNGEKRSPLAGVPAGLPALAQAEAYLDRMSRLRPAATPQSPRDILAALPTDAPPTAEQVGEALFGLVAWAMAHGIEAESALRQANARFADQVAAEGWG